MKIVTKENLETIKAFQKHFMKVSSKPLIIVLLCLLFLGVVLLAGGNLYLGVFLCVFPIVFVIIYPISLKKANEKLNQSNKSFLEEKIVEIEFLEEKISTKTYLNNEMINSFVCQYNNIFKIEETDSYFYIYLALNQALCVDKKDIDEKETNEIRGLLQANCPKYKIYNR